MINREEYRNYLLQNMIGATVASGGDEVICKCKYCPDNGDHYHMYISIPRNEGEISYHNCFKCHTHGAVTYKKLLEWGIYDPQVAESITAHNKVASSKSLQAQIDLSDYVRKLININRDTELNRLKLKYINDRLGIGLSLSDLTDNGIVLDIATLLNDNHINQFTRDPRVIQGLSGNFLGFLSHDNCYLSLRNLTEPGTLHKSIDERYIIYNIFNKKDNTRKSIILPTIINTIEPVIVHIAEGGFDILSVKYNLRKQIGANNLYCAVTGNEYLSLFRYIIANMGIIDLELHLYLDNDKAGTHGLSNFIKVVKEGFPWINIYTHKNMIGKDMGVRLDQIKEYIEKI